MSTLLLWSHTIYVCMHYYSRALFAGLSMPARRFWFWRRIRKRVWCRQICNLIWNYTLARITHTWTHNFLFGCWNYELTLEMEKSGVSACRDNCANDNRIMWNWWPVQDDGRWVANGGMIIDAAHPVNTLSDNQTVFLFSLMLDACACNFCSSLFIFISFAFSVEPIQNPET